MRKFARKDSNHDLVRGLFVENGWRVCDTHSLGGGVVDMFVARDGRTVAVEIKDWDKPPSHRVLTEAEQRFQREWPGEYLLITRQSDFLKWLESNKN
jgi:hypothetical protein